MTSTDSPAAPAGDTAAVAGLLDRYLITLDDEKLDDDWARGLFTDDAVVAFPMNSHEGVAGMAEYHSGALAAFERTQHLGSPAVVSADGDRATLRANLISTHVHHPGGDRPPLFVTGTFVEGAARRTPEGWRLSRLSFRLVWAQGAPPNRAA